MGEHPIPSEEQEEEEEWTLPRVLKVWQNLADKPRFCIHYYVLVETHLWGGRWGVLLATRFAKGDCGQKDDVACGQGIKTQTGSSVRQLDRWPKEEGEKKSLKVFT